MGINGAAFAAFGDIDGAFLASFGARKEGVKLGESTLKVFFMLLKSCYIVHMAPEVLYSPFVRGRAASHRRYFVVEGTACF